MRRLRETGIVTILLLGLTGCAGVQHRLGWTEPPYAAEESTEERPLSRLAFWRRHQAEESVPAASASDMPEPGRTPMVAGNGNAAADDDEERPGLLRRLPLVGRLWKDSHHDESDELDMPAARYAPGAMKPQSVALAPPRMPASNNASQARSTRTADEPASASPVADADAPATDPASTTAAAGSDRQEDQPLRELTVDLAGARPQVDPAAVPARNPGPPAGAGPSVVGSPAQPRTFPEPPPITSQGREDVPPPVAAPGAQPSPVRAPPVPRADNRGPSLRRHNAHYLRPHDHLAAGDRVEPRLGFVVLDGDLLPGADLAGRRPDDVLRLEPVDRHELVQGEYVSGGCESSCGPKCKIHKLCPFKKHKAVMASSVVMPSAQGTVSSCEAPRRARSRSPASSRPGYTTRGPARPRAARAARPAPIAARPQ